MNLHLIDGDPRVQRGTETIPKSLSTDWPLLGWDPSQAACMLSTCSVTSRSQDATLDLSFSPEKQGAGLDPHVVLRAPPSESRESLLKHTHECHPQKLLKSGA